MSNDSPRLTPRVQRQYLMAKALGFTNTISKWSQEERVATPSKTYGADYNNLRDAVLSAFPDLHGYVPPFAEFCDVYDQRFGDRHVTMQSFGELQGWADQIYQLLSALDELEEKDGK